jgi:serine-type D-Ala-D-Ala carboxypeptidase/endopeptidase (penicillin-binding protein 4)
MAALRTNDSPHHDKWLRAEIPFKKIRSGESLLAHCSDPLKGVCFMIEPPVSLHARNSVMKRLLLWLLLVCVVIWVPAWSSLRSDGKARSSGDGDSSNTGGGLKAAITEIIDAPEYKAAHWGILVADLESGETIFEQNADKLFTPASVTKLFSVAAALEELGADHRFRTPVHQRGTLDKDGQLDGDLILVASGDLTLGGRTNKDGKIAFKNSDHIYANGTPRAELTSENPLAGLEDLAKQVANKGIKRIHGDVLIDDRLFDRASSSGSGPRTVTPIMVNDNLIDITVTPTEPGQRAKVTWRPQTASFQIDVQVETVAKGKEERVFLRSLDPYQLLIRGQIPAGHKTMIYVHEVPDAAAFARALFIEALERQGVQVDASPLAQNNAAKLPAKSEYAKLEKVAELASPPFAENAKLILKVSHNLHASTLPLLLAAKHGQQRFDAGLKRQRQVLAKLGVDVDSISFGGGAGGSNADCVTPRATVQLLRGMAKRPSFAAYEAALPVIGVDGTLCECVAKDCPVCGKARAKTGTLSWSNTMNGKTLLQSKALAGYLTDSRGRKLAFAIFVNHAHLGSPAETDRVGKTLGKLCEVLHR